MAEYGGQQMFVKTIEGKIITISYNYWNTISDIKSQIHAKTGIPIDEQKLVFGGKALDDKRTCSDYNIYKESTLWMVRKIRGSDGAAAYRYQTDAVAEVALRAGAEQCERDISASIIDFYHISPQVYQKIPTFPSVQQLLAHGPNTCVGEDGKPDFRWIHLPANNMSWVERLIQRVYDDPEVDPTKTDAERDFNLESNAHTADNSKGKGKGKGKEKAKATRPEPPTARQATLHDQNDAAALLLRPEYWSKREYVSRDSQGIDKSRFKRPSYARVSTEASSLGAQDLETIQDQTSNGFLFMPYLDYETMAMQDFRKRHFVSIAKKQAPSDLQQQPLGARVLISCFWEKLPVHDRRTLDQAFYYTTDMKTIWERDTDQVLWRYMKDENVPEDERRIVMVDQLWMWIIDSPKRLADGHKRGPKTILTAFSPRWQPVDADKTMPRGVQAQLDAILNDDPTSAYNKIMNALYRNHQTNIHSVTDLICLVIDKCAGMFHPLPNEGDGKLDYLDVFAVAIGNLASQQTKLSDAFWEHSESLSRLFARRDDIRNRSFRKFWTSSDSTIASITGIEHRFNDVRTSIKDIEHRIDEELRAMADITSETASLKEIKDVSDELNSIAQTFRQQISVAKLMVDDIGIQIRNETRRKLHANLPLSTVDNSENLEDTEFMYKYTLTVLERRLGDIESLETKAYLVYKNICDLLDLKQKQASVSQALSARQEAQDTAKQGKTLMLFTIVTIIFLPLSFIAAIFSMNAREINDYSRPIHEIFIIMFPTTAAIFALSLVFAYYTSITSLVVTFLTKRFGGRRTPASQTGPVGSPQAPAPPSLNQEPDEQPASALRHKFRFLHRSKAVSTSEAEIEMGSVAP